MRIMPSRRMECCPIGPMSTCWPNDHRIQIPTISADAFYRGYKFSLYTCTSIVSWIVLTYKNFFATLQTEHNASLIHIIGVFRPDIWIIQYLFDHVKPVHDLIIDVSVMTIPVHRPDRSRLELGMTSLKALGPVSAWRLHHFVRRGLLAGNGEG